jgi:hypothetical protein
VAGPRLAATFLDSLATTASRPDAVEVIVYADEDDPDSAGIREPRLSMSTIVGPQATMGTINTACLERASGDIVILANDDVVVRTKGWDEEIRERHRALPDGVYLAWPNDRFASGRMSTFPILSRSTCALLGDPFPGQYRGAFIDYELFDVFTRLKHRGHDRLLYLERVTFEHHHHRTGKRPPDLTSQRRQRWEDDVTFLARPDIRQEQAMRLAARIEGRPVPPRIAAPRDARFIEGLGDPGLPFRRRLYLFTWFCGRYVAARIWQ